MPRKQRHGKRRISPEAELEAWSQVFDCGHDFFGELADILDLGQQAPPNSIEYDKASRIEAETAWPRLGAAYLERYPNQGKWAREQFGDPRHAG